MIERRRGTGVAAEAPVERPRGGRAVQAGEVLSFTPLGGIVAYYVAKLDPQMPPEVLASVGTFAAMMATVASSEIRDWRWRRRTRR